MITSQKFSSTRYILFFIALLNCAISYQQTSGDASNEVEATHNKIVASLGNDQILSSGVFFENNYRNDRGHPYFLDDIYKEGYIIIRNKRYDNILLKYNIFSQEIVLINPKQVPKFAFKPPTDFIEEFGFNDYRFMKNPLLDSNNTFCQLVYNGDIKCYYIWKKKRSDSYHNISFMAYEYNAVKPLMYLIMDNMVLSFKSKGSFLKLFTPEQSKMIKLYLKQNKINIIKAPDPVIRELLAYCETISNQKESSSDDANSR